MISFILISTMSLCLKTGQRQIDNEIMKNILKKLKLKRRAITVLAGLHFYGNPSKKLKIVGVTGTNGKTTTVTLLYRIATALGYKAGLISTVENIIAGEIITTPDNRLIPGTTPDPISLHK